MQGDFIVGVNGIYCRKTKSAALLIKPPKGDDMQSEDNLPTVLENLRQGRARMGYGPAAAALGFGLWVIAAANKATGGDFKIGEFALPLPGFSELKMPAELLPFGLLFVTLIILANVTLAVRTALSATSRIGRMWRRWRALPGPSAATRR